MAARLCVGKVLSQPTQAVLVEHSSACSVTKRIANNQRQSLPYIGVVTKAQITKEPLELLQGSRRTEAPWTSIVWRAVEVRRRQTAARRYRVNQRCTGSMTIDVLRQWV
ncbi:hypothetical protein [Mycobacterium terramassiliense]|uniref:hypothetical protein n=1 Tax=Mycobacterium terramassiliense TaxID=1841859 RepID=UPI0012FF7120|nr:hypothetical protein [Mycobacterium terramassiliense]